MTDPAFIILFVILFIFSIYLGFTVGTYAGERAISAREYWVYNLIAVVVSVIATAFLTLVPLLCAVPLGFLAGCFTGLKMGYGESSGPWKWLDRFFNVNRAQQTAATRGTREAARRARRRGEAAPDVISVSDDASAFSASSKHGAPSRRKRKKR